MFKEGHFDVKVGVSFGIGYQVAILVISIVYAVVLMGLPLEIFKDRANYLVYATSPLEILARYAGEGAASVVFNEPIWLLLNIGLGRFFEPKDVVRSLIFFPALITSFLVLRSSPRNFIFLLAFLLAPQVVKNNIIHLRQGVAISVFLLGWFTVGNKRWLLMLLTPFIHASFFFILMLLFFNWICLRLRFAYDIRAVCYVVLGVSISAGLGFIATVLGARQAAGYEFTMASVSGLGFVFWLGVLVLYFLEGRDFLNKYSFAIGVLFFYLSTYFLVEVTARVFESAMLLVLFAGLSLTCWRRLVFLSIFIAYVLFGYYFRMDQPELGWGIV